MTKAQEKRNKQFREALTNRLTVLFNPFRNYNYKSYVNSKIYPHKTLLESHWGTYSNEEEAFESLEGKTFRELGLEVHVNSYISDPKFRKRTRKEMNEAKEKALDQKISGPRDLSNKLRQVQQSRNIMNLIEIHKLDWLLEVKEAFDNRFNKMLDSMCNSIEPKQRHFKIEVEELSNSWTEFEVLIHVEETTFHARAIWVNCVEKVSHYRFITTTRKRK